MAPKERKTDADNGLRKRRGGEAPAGKSSEDDALLNANLNHRWTDSFVVLCVTRWLTETGYDYYKRRQNGEAYVPSVAAKKKSEEEVPLKEKAIKLCKDSPLPVFLTLVLVLTCLLIIGGESIDHRSDRVKETVDDYYGTLAIPRDAETADVKRAYKTLARRWHPDKNPNCTTCQETFSKIATAYETLSDEKKRAAYDESGETGAMELKSPRSVPLTRDNFDELVTYSNDVWIVQLYKPEDQQCAQFHPFWENQIQKHGHMVRFGRVDVTNNEKWLPVKIRVLPMLLKFGKHLGAPEIFPINRPHETPQALMKFVLTSFPNVGLPVHRDATTLMSWLGSAARFHKVLFAIPGKSEEERYKTHLLPRMLASRWSDIFEFRTADTAVLHKLPGSNLADTVRSALPPPEDVGNKASIMLFPASGGSTPAASAVIPWPPSEDAILTELLKFAKLAAPTLNARSAELLCRSLAIRRVYCLVLLDASDADVTKATSELEDSRETYTKEVQDIRVQGGEVTEDEDNFVVHPIRLNRQAKGLQPSVATCKAPQFGQVEAQLEGSNAFLLDMDTGRFAALPGITAFRGVYPQIAYEDSLKWEPEGVLHPFLSLPDCDEGVRQHTLRTLRNAALWKLIVQFLSILLLLEAVAKAFSERSLFWGGGSCVLIFLMLIQSPPFLRSVSLSLPGSFFSPVMLQL